MRINTNTETDKTSTSLSSIRPTAKSRRRRRKKGDTHTREKEKGALRSSKRIRTKTTAIMRAFACLVLLVALLGMPAGQAKRALTKKHRVPDATSKKGLQRPIPKRDLAQL